MNWKRVLVSSSLLVTAVAWAQPAPPPVPRPPVGPGVPAAPGVPMGMHGPGMMHAPGLRAPGIPPHVAKKLGIPPDTVKKVQDATFDANDALIGLEADLKRARLALEKTLAQSTVDEAQVNAKLEAVSKAELAVRKNRMGLMLKIRKLLGQETWDKLQGEMPPPEDFMFASGGPGMRKEVRVIRHGDGTEVMEVNE